MCIRDRSDAVWIPSEIIALEKDINPIKILKNAKIKFPNNVTVETRITVF